ncbi:hypothetical protein Tco_1040630, partial [Tanacetum coccineum]
MLAIQVVEGEVTTVASHPQKTQTPRQAKIGRDTEIPQSSGPPKKVGDEAIHKELGDRVEKATTTAASLDAEQDSGNILKTQSTAIPNVPLSQEISTGGNTPGSDEERLEQHELTDNVPPTPHDLPLLGGHTLGSNEGRLKRDKLTDIVTALSQKVEGLESNLNKTKKLYATTFKKLINRVKSFEDELKFQKSKSKRRRLTLVTSEDEEDLERYGQNLETQEGFGDGQEVSTAAQVSTASTFVSTPSPQRNADTTADDLTLSGFKLAGMKKVAADEDLVQQLQAGEKYSEEDLPMKLVELVNQRKKLFTQQRVEAKKNKPMTPAQQKGLHVNLHQEPRR